MTEKSRNKPRSYTQEYKAEALSLGEHCKNYTGVGIQTLESAMTLSAEIQQFWAEIYPGKTNTGA